MLVFLTLIGAVVFMGLVFYGLAILDEHDRDDFKENCRAQGFRPVTLNSQLKCLNDNDVVVAER
jgi:hypothetical protein